MRSVLIEASDGMNHGKFLVGQYTPEELVEPSRVVDGVSLLGIVELSRHDNGDPADLRWVLDLQTGEGALMRPMPDRDADADLESHGIWVCPLYRGFVQWLYERGTGPIEELPPVAHFPIKKLRDIVHQGYRRPGPGFCGVTAIRERLVTALQALPDDRLPGTLVQVVTWMEAQLPEAQWTYLTLFRAYLGREWMRWCSTVLYASGRFISVAAGPGRIAFMKRNALTDRALELVEAAYDAHEGGHAVQV